jgi:hypothetical protein
VPIINVHIDFCHSNGYKCLLEDFALDAVSLAVTISKRRFLSRAMRWEAKAPPRIGSLSVKRNLL